MSLDPTKKREYFQKTQWLGPIEFVASHRFGAAKHLIELAFSGQGQHVHLANAYTIALADKSHEYCEILQRPAVNYPDGKPLTWISAFKGHRPALQQIRGPQLFLDVFDKGRTRGLKHFLLGSTPEVLESLQRNLQERFPGVEIVGSESPPFRALSQDELRAQDSRIRKSGAHLVWVGLGTPKQDAEVARLAKEMPIVAVAIGAAFDFAAGAVREAPSWMSKAGLEWTFRLASEPRRLWKRYLFGNTRFLYSALFTNGRRRAADQDRSVA